MNSLYFLFSFIVLNQVSQCLANSSSHKPVREKILKYDFNLENTLQLKAKSGQAVFLSAADLALLSGAKIHHIDLVYSKYTGSNSASQDQLHFYRIDNLKKALPQILKDEPTWKYIEQTGAQTLEEARTFFHGFIVHYGPSLDYQHLKDFFSPFQTAPESFMVDAKVGGTFKCKEGSTLHIAANAVSNSDGTPTEGKFTMQYKAFKDPADIVFSGIPMTYNNGNEDLNFSSVGMYDLRASQNGKDLALAEPIAVDFNCTEPATGAAFYQMDDVTGAWTKDKDVNFVEAAEAFLYTRKSKLEFDGQYFELNSKVYEAYAKIHFDEASWDWFFLHLAIYPKLNELVKHFDESAKTAETIVRPKEFVDVIVEIMVEEKKTEMKRERLEWEEKEKQKRKEEAEKMAKLREKNAKIAEKAAEASQFSASIVNGLNSPNFGVYNCDQLYRLEEPLALSPTYVDENGTEIASKHVVSVVDLNFNGSFSFHPNNITCSAVGKNVILLFTDDKSVFMLNQAQFAQLNLKGNLRPTFKMKNMTGIIKTSDDLKGYLKV